MNYDQAPSNYLTAEEIHALILATRERMVANVRVVRASFSADILVSSLSGAPSWGRSLRPVSIMPSNPARWQQS
jgi:hypothetical protein